MLRASIGFLLIGLVVLALGYANQLGISFETSRMMFFVHLGLALVSFLIALIPYSQDQGLRSQRSK
jgi:uncharacterized membrane protein YtjA (UPF0391 family)